MQYLKLTATERAQLMRSLEDMPHYLARQFERLSAAEARVPGPAQAFSPVEQVWHLADLEREGFGERIRRLRDEPNPRLPDFDGAAVARERAYHARSLAAGLAAFGAARAANLAMLAALPAQAWQRRGVLDGVGAVSLCDLPMMLQQHDEAHRHEIEAWCAARAPRRHA